MCKAPEVSRGHPLADKLRNAIPALHEQRARMISPFRQACQPTVASIMASERIPDVDRTSSLFLKDFGLTLWR